MVHISAVSRSLCLGACNGQLHANISETSFPASFTRQCGSPFRSQNIFCRDTITSLIVFYGCHHIVGRWNPFLTPQTQSPWGSTVRLPRQRHATWTLCLLPGQSPQSCVRMSVLQNGSDGQHLPAFTDAFSCQRYSSQAL